MSLSKRLWSAVPSPADGCDYTHLRIRVGNNRSCRASWRVTLSNTDNCTEGGTPQCNERLRLRGARGEQNILLR